MTIEDLARDVVEAVTDDELRHGGLLSIKTLKIVNRLRLELSARKDLTPAVKADK